MKLLGSTVIEDCFPLASVTRTESVKASPAKPESALKVLADVKPWLFQLYSVLVIDECFLQLAVTVADYLSPEYLTY